MVSAIYLKLLSTWFLYDIHSISVNIIVSAPIWYQSSSYLHREVRLEPLVFFCWGVAPRVTHDSCFSYAVVEAFVGVAVYPEAGLVLRDEVFHVGGECRANRVCPVPIRDWLDDREWNKVFRLNLLKTLRILEDWMNGLYLPQHCKWW